MAEREAALQKIIEVEANYDSIAKQVHRVNLNPLMRDTHLPPLLRPLLSQGACSRHETDVKTQRPNQTPPSYFVVRTFAHIHFMPV